jgi:hypothetical protein
MKKFILKRKKLLSLKYFVMFFGFILLLISCEGFVEYTGVIFDAQTKEPLDSVKCVMVAFKQDNIISYSDSAGIYHISTPLIGCVPNCGEYDVEFSRQGYKTQIVTAPADIYMEKE